MLILKRKVGTKIKVGDDIEVVLVEINSDSARIGIEAPADVKIVRDNAVKKTRD